MVRKIVSATVSAALCVLSVQPALAQDHRFSGFDAPQGVTATVNLTIPLGERGRAAAPSYGVTLRYGYPVGPATLDERGPRTRAVDLADFRFAGGELRNARIAAFDLANPDRGQRMNLSQGKAAWTIWLVAALALGAALCFLECRSDDEQPLPYVPPQ